MGVYDDIIGAFAHDVISGRGRNAGGGMFGAEDIVGAGAEIAIGQDPELNALFGYNLFGADAALAAPQSQATANRDAFVRDLAARHAAAVMPRPLTKAREYPMGFPTTALAAGATATITVQPQVPFRGRRLIIPSDIAGSILINDIKVGKNSMLASSGGPIPGRTFSEFGVGVDLNLDTAQISQQISLNVTNTSGAQVTFNAALIGTAVE